LKGDPATSHLHRETLSVHLVKNTGLATLNRHSEDHRVVQTLFLYVHEKPSKEKITEDNKMATAKDKTPANVDKVFIGTSDVDTPHDDVEPDDAAVTSKHTAPKSTSKSKTDDTADLSYGLAYGYGSETTTSTVTMTGAKSKTSKLSYTTVTTPSTSYPMTIPSAPSHGFGVSMTPPPGHPMQPPASLSISDTTFTLKSFSGAANTEDTAEKWVESFLLYTDFKRMSAGDSLRLFKLLLTDQAADWLKALPDYKKSSFDRLIQAFNERYALTRVDRWRKTAEIWSRKQGPNESVDDYVAAMQSAASRVNMPEDYLADAILQGLKPELRLFVLYAGVETIPEILKIARTSEAAHSADKSTTTTSDINTKLDFVMQQQAETMKTLKLMEETNKCSNIMSDQLALSKRVTFAQAAMSENDQRNDRRYSRRDSPARSVSPSERNSDTRSNYARSQSPVRYGSSANLNMSNDGRTSDQRRDARNVGANRQVWRPQRQWSTTSPTGMQSQGPQSSSSAPYNTTFNGQSRYIDPLQQRMVQNYARCTYCGRQHPFGKMYCPAANVQCFNCSRMGHLAKMCRSAPRAQGAMYIQ
jgi:hypothetical protein